MVVMIVTMHAVDLLFGRILHREELFQTESFRSKKLDHFLAASIGHYFRRPSQHVTTATFDAGEGTYGREILDWKGMKMPTVGYVQRRNLDAH